MHAGTVDLLTGFGHKGSMKPVSFCNRPHRHLKGHQLIRRAKCIFIREIDLVLGRSDLMMRGLDLISHFLQCQNDIPSGILSQINRRSIQISCLLMGQRCRQAVIIRMEQEKLTFRVYLKRISHRRSPLQRFFQNPAGTDLIFTPVLPADITQKTGNLSVLRPPWKNREGIQIRFQIQILFFSIYKTVQRRAVYGTVIFQHFY